MNDEKDLKSEENLTEEGNSVKNEVEEEKTDFLKDPIGESTEDPIGESTEDPIGESTEKVDPSVKPYLDEAKRFSDRFGDKGALDVILELDKKIDEIWKKIF